jgi:hypothetical protein
MRSQSKIIFFIFAQMCCFWSAVASDELKWPEVQLEHRPGTIWWWPGSAVDEENITWNLEGMRAAGIGGATIVPIYGVAGYEENFIEFLTPSFVDRVSYASAEAKRLGMWVDMTPGTGWPFGGPMILPEYADARVVYQDGKISQKFSGRKVKRAAPGNAGKAVNPFSVESIRFYLKHFDKPFGGVEVVMPRAFYHDSYEFMGNWTRELPDEFERRRGYDLMDHLPELFGEGDAETVSRIKADYRETLSDLHLEYMRAWVQWSEFKGCTTRNQAHGSPSNILDLYAASGIPETETFGASKFDIPGIRRTEETVSKDKPQPLINRMASSAANVSGKTLVSSETCTWVRNHFHSALSQVKPEIDQLFLNGINHIFFHGTCYSPKQATWPGWLFYASLQYNSRNAIWRDAPYLNAYVTRCQSILQSGEPDNDVALYWPAFDIWHSTVGMQQQLTVHNPAWLLESACGEAASWLQDQGYGFDFISDRQLQAGLGDSYGAIVVPKTGHIPLATARQLMAAADRGQPVIFLNALPADVPGFHDFENRRAELGQLLKGREHRVVALGDLKSALEPTAVVREPLRDAGLDFIRRRHDGGFHYFIANMSDAAVDGWITLGVSFETAIIMDANSGKVGLATQREDSALYLQLLPGETRIIRTFDDKQVEGPIWPIFKKSNDPPFTVEGAWQVTFVDGGPELPKPFFTKELKSWTEFGSGALERFAGTASYRIEFMLPSVRADDWIIDLGDVRESARVSFNGKEVACLYSIPFRALVGDYLKPGRNVLEIEVTNLSANRIRDLDRRGVNWKIFNDINFVDHHYQKFDASDWLLIPSGLLGPITLTPVKMALQDFKTL